MRSVPGPLVVAACALAVRAYAAPVDSADDVCPPAASPCEVAADLVVASGSTLDFGGRLLVVKPGASLDAEGGTMQILAGAVTVEAGGALRSAGGAIIVVSTGPLAVLRAGRTAGRVEVGSAAIGGHLALSALGDVTVQGDVDAIGKDQSAVGGVVQIGGNAVTITGTVDASGGRTGAGGSVEVAAAASITVTGRLDATGADGGDVTLDAGTELAFDGSIDVQATGDGGSGGDVYLVAAAGGAHVRGALVLRGNDGSDYGGVGGHLEASAADSLTLDGDVDLTGGPPEGEGGDAILSAGLDLVQRAEILVHGKGDGSGGGSVDWLAQRRLVLGRTDAHGAATGGGLSATAWCELEVPAGVTLDARGALTGDVRLETGGSMTVAGSLLATTATVLARRPGGSVVVTGTTAPPAATVDDDVLVPCGGPPTPGCGNQVVDAGEECDDGNADPCDACTNACRVPACGNGVAECQEGCDDGNHAGCDGCAADCSRVDHVCGDGVVECGEQDDRGDTLPCDGVSPTCALEACGNGVLDCPEACDDGPAGSATCSPTCTALVPGCGDGTVDPGEECDDGGVADCDGCSPLCLREGPGNGIVECGEACDDGNASPCDGCGAGGQLEACGNGILDCQETCDDGAANGTAASMCLPDTCTRGELCTPDSTGPCIACATASDCGPLGACGGDRCEAGVCVLGLPPRCDDGDPCTADACDPASGCTHAARSCDDGLPCTVDACVPSAGGCTHTPGGCPPGTCTADTCTDGDPCTAEACDPTAGCVARGVVRCDDDDRCTDDGCDPASGCTHVRRTGAAGLRCLVEAIQAYLAGPGATEVGPKTRKRLARVLAAMLAKSDGLVAGDARKAARAARAVVKLRSKAERTVRRARDLQGGAAATLLDLLVSRMPALR